MRKKVMTMVWNYFSFPLYLWCSIDRSFGRLLQLDMEAEVMWIWSNKRIFSTSRILNGNGERFGLLVGWNQSTFWKYDDFRTFVWSGIRHSHDAALGRKWLLGMVSSCIHFNSDQGVIRIWNRRLWILVSLKWHV